MWPKQYLVAIVLNFHTDQKLCYVFLVIFKKETINRGGVCRNSVSLSGVEAQLFFSSAAVAYQNHYSVKNSLNVTSIVSDDKRPHNNDYNKRLQQKKLSLKIKGLKKYEDFFCHLAVCVAVDFFLPNNFSTLSFFYNKSGSAGGDFANERKMFLELEMRKIVATTEIWLENKKRVC